MGIFKLGEGAMQMGSSIIQMTGQGLMNRRNRKWQEKQNKINREYESQWNRQNRQWALDDWAMQNAYNSPQQQMQRLKEAGLNPNLIYGEGATNQAETVRSSNPSATSQEAPQIDSSFLAPMGELIMNMIRTDNLRAQKDLLDAQKNVQDAQKLNIEAQERGTDWATERSRSFYDLDKQILEEELNKKKADIQFTLDSNDRATIELALKSSANDIALRRLALDIANSKIQNAKTQAEIDNLNGVKAKILNDTEWENSLREVGLTPGGGVIQNATSMFSKLWHNLTD